MPRITRDWPYTALFGIGSWICGLVLILAGGIAGALGGEPKGFIALGVVGFVVGLMGWIAAIWAIDSGGHGIRSLPMSRALAELQWGSAVVAAASFISYRGVGLVGAISAVVLGAGIILALSRRQPRGLSPGDLISLQHDDGYALALVKSVRGDSVELLCDFAPTTKRRPRAVKTSIAQTAHDGESRVLETHLLRSLRPRLIWRGLATT